MRNVASDDLNYVFHGWHEAHDQSRNFAKAKMCKTNCSFEKFQNAFNLIYTVCAMLEMMIKAMFAIVSMMRITTVEIS